MATEAHLISIFHAACASVSAFSVETQLITGITFILAGSLHSCKSSGCVTEKLPLIIDMQPFKLQTYSSILFYVCSGQTQEVLLYSMLFPWRHGNLKNEQSSDVIPSLTKLCIIVVFTLVWMRGRWLLFFPRASYCTHLGPAAAAPLPQICIDPLALNQ